MNGRRLHHLDKFVHKILNLPYSYHSLKNKILPRRRRNIHNKSTRYKNVITMAKHKTELFKKAFHLMLLNF